MLGRWHWGVPRVVSDAKLQYDLAEEQSLTKHAQERLTRPPVDLEAPLWDVLEAADFIRQPRGWLYKQLKNGSLPYVKVGGRYLIPREAFMRALGQTIPEKKAAS
jgi:excisionase family DNA binding protein